MVGGRVALIGNFGGQGEAYEGPKNAHELARLGEVEIVRVSVILDNARLGVGQSVVGNALSSVDSKKCILRCFYVRLHRSNK